jgi:hypothetical protein
MPTLVVGMRIHRKIHGIPPRIFTFRNKNEVGRIAKMKKSPLLALRLVGLGHPAKIKARDRESRYS